MTESWTNRFLLPCPFKHFTGMDCPGCGFQRSVLALLKGNWLESWHYYPATVPILLLALFFLVKIKVQFPDAENLLQVLHKERTRYLETNMEAFYSTVRGIIKQRSLLIFFTNFEKFIRYGKATTLSAETCQITFAFVGVL